MRAFLRAALAAVTAALCQASDSANGSRNFLIGPGPAAAPASTAAPVFALVDRYVGHAFRDAFEWESIDDPTHGRVNYIDQATAFAKNLSFTSGTKFVMRPDDASVVSSSARGRDSIRIHSKNAYDDSVIVLDVEHMPEGCGTWPAFWTVSKHSPWPNGGEIDIIEGVNTNVRNLASLHTAPGCTMPQSRMMSGSTTSTDCNAYVNGNQGCGVAFSKPGSYGAPLNAGGGGWFAVQRTGSSGVSVWFWARTDPTVPADVRAGARSVRPDANWGVPEARFPADQCDFRRFFDAAMIIFDLTFCGDWAGGVYASMGCPGKCVDYVDNNPAAFSNAYWEINSLAIYTPIQEPAPADLVTSNTGPHWVAARDPAHPLTARTAAGCSQ